MSPVSELRSYIGSLARQQELLERLQELLISQETTLITALVKMVQKRSWLHARSSLRAQPLPSVPALLLLR